MLCLYYNFVETSSVLCCFVLCCVVSCCVSICCAVLLFVLLHCVVLFHFIYYTVYERPCSAIVKLLLGITFVI